MNVGLIAVFAACFIFEFYRGQIEKSPAAGAAGESDRETCARTNNRTGPLHLRSKGCVHNRVLPIWCEPGVDVRVQAGMLSPSSSRRQRRRVGSWTYATAGEQVLWYCPPGGSIPDRCKSWADLDKYHSKKGKRFSRKDFTFLSKHAAEIPWMQLADEVHDEEEEDGGSMGLGACGGGGEGTCSSSPARGKVRMHCCNPTES